jgi:hypothetical protein
MIYITEKCYVGKCSVTLSTNCKDMFNVSSQMR